MTPIRQGLYSTLGGLLGGLLAIAVVTITNPAPTAAGLVGITGVLIGYACTFAIIEWRRG